MNNVKQGTALADFAYTLDAVGNPTEVVRSGSLPETQTFGYDAQDRLTDVCFQASCPGGSDPFIRYTYDGVGNRLTEARPAGTTSYDYNAGDELTDAGSTSYDYDANGNGDRSRIAHIRVRPRQPARRDDQRWPDDDLRLRRRRQPSPAVGRRYRHEVPLGHQWRSAAARARARRLKCLDPPTSGRTATTRPASR